jgi:hypothetical protein
MNMEINLSAGMWLETVGRSSLAPRVMAPKIVRPPSRARKVTTVEPRVTRSLTRASGSSGITSTPRSLTAGSGAKATARFAFGSGVKRLREQSSAVTADLVAAAVGASTKNEADGEDELTNDSSDDKLEIGNKEILETLERPRKRRALSSVRGAIGGGGGLAQDAVRPQTQERYRLYESAFLPWTGIGTQAGFKADVIDQKLVNYFEYLFAAGHNPYVVSVTPRVADECLWFFAYPALLKEVMAAAARLDVPMVTYLFLHCGPSWDILKKNRSLPDVQIRMRVRSARTVARYEKNAATLAVFDSYPAGKKQYFDVCDKGLRSVVLGLRLPTKFRG